MSETGVIRLTETQLIFLGAAIIRAAMGGSNTEVNIEFAAKVSKALYQEVKRQETR